MMKNAERLTSGLAQAGRGSPESLCGFASLSPVRAVVKPPPAPSRRDVMCKRRATVRIDSKSDSVVGQ
jgi:hypothetical protein